eukprot:974972-Rhodomonas_salina.2
MLLSAKTSRYAMPGTEIAYGCQVWCGTEKASGDLSYGAVCNTYSAALVGEQTVPLLPAYPTTRDRHRPGQPRSPYQSQYSQGPSALGYALRRCYAMSGTDKEYAARAAYAMSGTEIGSLAACRVSGTCIAHAASTLRDVQY